MAEKGGFGLFIDRPYFMGFLFICICFAPLFCPKNPIKTALAVHLLFMPGLVGEVYIKRVPPLAIIVISSLLNQRY